MTILEHGSPVFPGCSGNPDAKRLYDDLLSNYNKLVRPVVNVTDALTVKIKLKLSQLIDVVSSDILSRGHVTRTTKCEKWQAEITDLRIDVTPRKRSRLIDQAFQLD